MGDFVGVVEVVIGDLYEVGYIEGEFGGDIEEIGFFVGDGNNCDQGLIVLYEYIINNILLYVLMIDGVNIFGNVIFGLGMIVIDLEIGLEVVINIDSVDLVYLVVVKYEGLNFWVLLLYLKNGDVKEIGLGVEVMFNNFVFKGVYMDYEDIVLQYIVGLVVLYQMDVILVKGFWC